MTFDECNDLPRGMIFDTQLGIMLYGSTKYRYGVKGYFYYECDGDWLRADNEHAESEHKRLFNRGYRWARN